MRIQDFTDMDKFHEIMKNWARATGLATVAVDMDGNYISDCFNFTDFCVKYTRVQRVRDAARNVTVKEPACTTVMQD